MRYVRSTFVDIYDPTIEDAFRHQTVVDGTSCVLDILDTAGQEDMKMLRRQWVEDRDGFLLVFSIVDKTTFIDIDQFYELISEVKEENLSNIPLVLVGNKCDLEDRREVLQKEAQEMGDRIGATYVETSAKTGEGVSEAFAHLVRRFIQLQPSTGSKNKGSKNRRKFPCIVL